MTGRCLQTQSSKAAELISFIVDHTSQYSNDTQIKANVQYTFKSTFPGSNDNVNVIENEIAN